MSSSRQYTGRRIREISSVAELEDLAGRLLAATSLSDLGLEILGQ